MNKVFFEELERIQIIFGKISILKICWRTIMTIFDKETVQERYGRWWEGKYCKLPNDPDGKFKYVQTVEFVGPPSGFYGAVVLHYLDGSSDCVPVHRGIFRPRKSDVIVEEDLK